MKEERDKKNIKAELKWEASEQKEKMEREKVRGFTKTREERDTQAGKGGNENDL